jgi:hypothetical protein
MSYAIKSQVSYTSGVADLANVEQYTTILEGVAPEPMTAYRVEIHLKAIEDAVPVDVKVDFGSASFVGDCLLGQPPYCAAMPIDENASELESSLSNYGTSNCFIVIRGLLITSYNNRATVRVQAKQTTADATSTYIPDGSYIIVTPLD